MLEGRVAMVDADGREVPVEPGQSFCSPQWHPDQLEAGGFSCASSTSPTRSPAHPPPRIASAEGGVVVLDPVKLEKDGLEKLEHH